MKTSNYINFTLLSATVILVISIPIYHWLYEHAFGDFRGYYAAASVIRKGDNPYDYAKTGAVLNEVIGSIGNYPFYYPPWFGWIMLPFTVLPYRNSLLLWMFLNIVLWFVGLQLLTSVLEISWKGWKLYLLYFILTLVFFWITIKYEQVGIMLMVFYLLGIRALKQQKVTEAGLWLGACLIKPNVMALPVIVLCVWLSLRKIWQPILVAVGLNFILGIISLLIMPDWYKPLFAAHAFDGIYHDGVGQALRYTTTLPHLLVMYGVITWQTAQAMFIPILLMGVITLALVVKKSTDLFSAVMLTVLIALAVSPYIQAYDYPILALPFAYLITRPLKLIHFLMIGLILAVPLLGPYLTKNYIIVIALTVMLLNSIPEKRLDVGAIYRV